MPYNRIILQGYLCKEPIYRETPLGREITDLLLAVNRPYGKSDYIPCICWGRNARYASKLHLFALKGDCDASTVSGWVIDQLGRLPLAGDHFQAEGLDVTVTRVDHRRVLEVRVAQAAEEPEPAGSGSEH